MKNFDSFIGIDWSGSEKPIHTPSIAVARCDRGQGAPTLIEREKLWSRAWVADYIESLLQEKKRFLIGIDANFGYQEDRVRNHLRAFGIQNPHEKTAADLWAVVNECSKDQPNFYAKPFWADPRIADDFWTEGAQPEGLKLPRRATEAACQNQGLGKPESPFKLIGAKQVGKGGLAAMRMAHCLKEQHGDAIMIWPFEKGDPCFRRDDNNFTLYNKARIVITEIYPRQFIKRAGFGNNKIRDVMDLNKALQVLAARPVTRLDITDHQTDALISAAGLRALCGDQDDLPAALTRPFENNNIARHEGWIFGVGI